MRRMHYALLAIAALAVTAARASSQTPDLTPPQPQIVVTSQGEVKGTPDRASAIFAVETRAKTAGAAAAENAAKQKAVVDALRSKFGITGNQVSTFGYSVHPEHRRIKETDSIVGYVVRNSISVEMQKLDRIGAVIDAALANGANVISSLRFYSSNDDELRRQALAKAVTAARADAEVMARAAGGTLGKLFELSAHLQVPYPPQPMYARDMAAMSVETPVMAGEQTVTATVNARWEFQQGAR